MMTLYHAPQSRSSRIVTLIDELGADVAIRDVDVGRYPPGRGAVDPANPHPEGKVPFLVDDGTGGRQTLRESPAIILYLCEKFPKAGLGRAESDPARAAFLTWLFYYGSVIEPVMILDRAEIDHPVLRYTFRGMREVLTRMIAALSVRPFLVDDRYSAADLLVSSAFAWNPDALPEVPAVRDWQARCQGRPSVARTLARDEAARTAFA